MAEFAKAFVAGFPVDRSLSPLIHRYWLQVYGLKGSCEPVLVSPEGFSHFFADIGADTYIGGAVIAPHKAAALALTPQADSAAKITGAVNAVWLENGIVHGTNSEVRGFAAHLDSACPGWGGESALLLGAGAMAASVICALAERGFSHIIIAAPPSAAALVSAMQSKVKAKVTLCSVAEAQGFVPQVSLIAHCGAAERAAAAQPNADGDSPLEQEQSAPPAAMLDFGAARGGAIAVETASAAEPTLFLQQAAAAGLPTADGLGILLHQAVVGFEHWFGQKPEVTAELRAYILGKM